jgi:hypothetical protein
MRMGRPKKVSPDPTLSKLGISRDQASQWQRMAEIPKDQFEALLTDPRHRGRGGRPGKPTTSGMLRLAGMEPQQQPQLNVEVYEAEGVVVTITAEQVVVQIEQQTLRWSR